MKNMFKLYEKVYSRLSTHIYDLQINYKVLLASRGSVIETQEK